MRRFPAWWQWQLELSIHLWNRMAERGFTEVDLRTMLSAVTRLRPDVVPGRWVARTRWRRHPWEIILEPDHDVRRIVVVTAYLVEP